MKKHILEAVKIAWEVTVQCEAMECVLWRLQDFLGKGRPSDDQEVLDAANVIRQALIRKELDAWRSILMWQLTDEIPKEQRDRIRETVYQRFLSEGMTVIHHLTPGLKYPGRWRGDIEEEFREELARAFRVSKYEPIEPEEEE